MLEVVTPTALEVQERAQIDVQITTARRYPRPSLAKVKARIIEIATMDMETAQGCFYTLPARKGGDGKAIAGPSARLAEIVVATYGNLKSAARVVANDGKFITAQGVCHDLENNVSVSVEVKRSISGRNGTYSQDMQVVTGNAACSIALRNAVFKVVPLSLIKPAYDAARKVAVGDVKTLAARRVEAFKYFIGLGVPKEKVCAAVGVKLVEEIDLEKLESLIGMANAIRDGEASVDDTFNAPVNNTPAPSAGIAAAMGASQAPAPAPVKADDANGPKGEQGQPGEFTPEQRAMTIEGLQNYLLDTGTSDSALFKLAKIKRLTPEGISDVWELPTGNLVALLDSVTAMSKEGVK